MTDTQPALASEFVGSKEETEAIQEDYFGFEHTHRVLLPDRVSWVEHQEFNEGQRRKYLNAVNRDVVIQRKTGDARMRMAPGDERHELLSTAIVGWNLVKGGQPISFTPQNLSKFLSSASPKIIDLIEKEVRKANPWLMAEMTLEDIDKEIANLQEMRDAKAKEEEAQASF